MTAPNARRHHRRLAGVVFALCAVIVVVPACHGADRTQTAAPAASDRPSRPSGSSLQIERTIHLGGTPSGIAAADGSLWVANADDNRVWRVDPKTGKVLATLGKTNYGVPSYGPQDYVDAGYGGVWVSSDVSNDTREIDPTTNRVVRAVRLPPGGTPLSVAVGEGAVWLPDFTHNHVLRIDPRRGRVVATIHATGPTDVAAGPNGVWVVAHRAASLMRVDPGTDHGAVIARHLGTVPERVAAGFGSAWVSDPQATSVFRLDMQTGSLQATVRLPKGLPVYELAAGARTLWVGAGRLLFAVDPTTNSVIGSVEIGSSDVGGMGIGDMAVLRAGVWVTSNQGDLYLVAEPAR